MADSQDEKLVNIIKEKFEDQVVLVEQLYDFLTITFKKDRIIEIIEFLYENPETKYQFLTTLFAVHYPDQKAMAIVYQLHNLVNNHRVRLKIYLSEENPSVPTLTNVFSAANWMERETYDFFGVTFDGHPNLKRILNVEDMIIFPMRKEYPLEDQQEKINKTKCLDDNSWRVQQTSIK
ncbi:MAG: NADH-quinone oxidoreductase subunit C [Bacteroidota bacterium]